MRPIPEALDRLARDHPQTAQRLRAYLSRMSEAGTLQLPEDDTATRATTGTRLLQELRLTPGRTAKELYTALDMSRFTAWDGLKRLKKNGYIRAEGKPPARYYVNDGAPLSVDCGQRPTDLKPRILAFLAGREATSAEVVAAFPDDKPRSVQRSLYYLHDRGHIASSGWPRTWRRT